MVGCYTDSGINDVPEFGALRFYPASIYRLRNFTAHAQETKNLPLLIQGKDESFRDIQLLCRLQQLLTAAELHLGKIE